MLEIRRIGLAGIWALSYFVGGLIATYLVYHLLLGLLLAQAMLKAWWKYGMGTEMAKANFLVLGEDLLRNVSDSMILVLVLPGLGVAIAAAFVGFKRASRNRPL